MHFVPIQRVSHQKKTKKMDELYVDIDFGEAFFLPRWMIVLRCVGGGTYRCYDTYRNSRARGPTLCSPPPHCFQEMEHLVVQPVYVSKFSCKLVVKENLDVFVDELFFGAGSIFTPNFRLFVNGASPGLEVKLISFCFLLHVSDCLAAIRTVARQSFKLLELSIAICWDSEVEWRQRSLWMDESRQFCCNQLLVFAHKLNPVVVAHCRISQSLNRPWSRSVFGSASDTMIVVY